ncbi:MAG: helix-turn-helix domain-containing protein [Rhodospirillales bacterium]
MNLTKDKMLHYTVCGLDYVYLQNGFTCEETEYGPATAVEDIDGLHRAVAFDIIRHRAHLQGQEVRFLRKELDMSQSGLALFFDASHQTVARWEKDQSVIPGSADRLLRLLYVEHIGGNEKISELLKTLAEMDDLEHAARQFEDTPQGWRLAA